MNSGDMAGSSRSVQRRMKLLEIEREQRMEEAEALKMTEEQHQFLSRPFMSVKVEFSDLDGQQWTKSALRKRYQDAQHNSMRLRSLMQMTRPSQTQESQKLAQTATTHGSAPADREVDNYGMIRQSQAAALQLMGYLTASRYRTTTTSSATKPLYVDTTPIQPHPQSHSQYIQRKDYPNNEDFIPHDYDDSYYYNSNNYNNASLSHSTESLESEPPTPTPYNYPGSIHYVPALPPGLQC